MYLLAAWSMLRSLNADVDKTPNHRRRGLVLATLGLAFQAAYVLALVWFGATLDFSLANMSLVVSAIIILIFLLGCIGLRIARLGVLMFPLTALCLAFSLVWGGTTATETPHPLLPLSAFSVHVLVAVLGYSFLTIATVQSLLYAYQEKQFKARTTTTLLTGLPALQTMEQLLFRLLWIGFLLLTLTLLSGAFFGQQIFGRAFEFNHHIVLAILGWSVYAFLLAKRTVSGIRGTSATSLTVVGFLLIQLGYFGTKFINESLNL